MGVTPVCRITEAGVIRPTFDTCLAYVQDAYRAIYGQDVYLGADSQDGQLMALFANALHDCNGQALATYNAFSPSTAQGAGLSSIVKTNGIRRKAATFSTCDFVCVGQAGAVISDPVLRDADGNLWALSDFTVPDAGQLVVSGTCQTSGSIALPALALDTVQGKGAIAAPQLGWQAARNEAAAALGQPVEGDTALRQRQALSTALPSQSLLEGLHGALLAISGVTRCRPYENDKGYPDANGLPGHSVSVVIDGGDARVIADVIRRKKGNAGTYGTTLQQITDSAGIPRDIRFCRSVDVPIRYELQIRKTGTYTAKTDLDLRTALSAFTNDLGIGQSVYLDDAEVAAKFDGATQGMGYRLVRLAAGRDGNAPRVADVMLDYDERAICTPDDVTTQILP